jgi:molecular chaperone DnaK
MQSLISYFLISAMSEFKDQLEETEKLKVTKLVTELRELAFKGQSGDASISTEDIRTKIGETQTASLGLFQKVSCLLPVESRPALTPF